VNPGRGEEPPAAAGALGHGEHHETGGLLTVDEAAAYLGVKRKTVYEWGRVGRIPRVRFGHKGCAVRFPKAALDAIADEWRLRWQPGDTTADVMRRVRDGS
jgi:excisionase family DNA binding protein